MKDKWVSVSAAAKIVGCSRQTIYAMAAFGARLTSRIVAGRIVILRTSAAKERERRRARATI